MAASRATWPLGPGLRPLVRLPRRARPTSSSPPSTTTTTPSARRARIEDGYHLSADLADRAIEFLGDLRAVDADRPFFLYFCTGACHSPHHAPPEWIDRYRGRFDAGWDALARADLRPPAGAGRHPGRHRALAPPTVGTGLGRPRCRPSATLAARFMECFAGFLSYTDAQIGRLFAFLDDIGRARQHGGHAGLGQRGQLRRRAGGVDQRHPADEPRPGGRAEMYERIDEIGGPLTHNNYPWGWTMAGNTPFKRWKREVHEGGVADPVHRQLAGPAAGEVRAASATSSPTPSTSCPRCSSWSGSTRPTRSTGVRPVAPRRHQLRAICSARAGRRPGRARHPALRDARLAGHLPRRMEGGHLHPVGPIYDDGLNPNAPFDDDVWELYHVAEDLSETARPGRPSTRTAGRAWSSCGGRRRARNDVLPLDNRLAVGPRQPEARPPPAAGRSFRYFPAGPRSPSRWPSTCGTAPMPSRSP